MVTATQVVIDRADLEALLEAAAGNPVRMVVLERCHQALADTPPGPPWHLIAEPISRISAFERDLAPHRAAQLDQVQARLRQGLEALGVTISDPTACHQAIALLAYIRATAVHDQRAHRLTATEGTAVRAVCAGLAAALTRWIPAEARP